MLEHSIFVGHDSGISHLAAAAGANCVLVFGPTDPNIWAPRNENVQVLSAQSGRLDDLAIASVEAAVIASLRSSINEKHASGELGGAGQLRDTSVT